jgi:hypothetical protein
MRVRIPSTVAVPKLILGVGLLLFCTARVTAQGSAANPLVELNDELAGTLAEAGVPFSEEQAKAVTLMMEERRRASEELFGNLMDFRGGPPQGQEADRLKSAIDWVRTEFLNNLNGYLTEDQAEAWERHQRGASSGATAAETVAGPATPSQTQYVRINNNGFTAEDSGFSSSGSGTEVIQRGGLGAWHGNAQFLLKDDALNARNAFADNKPSYQERRLSVDASGPLIRGRLTSSVDFNQTEAENVGTIRATLPDSSIFALGITRPTTYRNIQSNQTWQLADSHSLRGFARFSTEENRDQGIGGFSLPDRAYRSTFRQVNAGVRPFSAVSAQTLLEGRVIWNQSRFENQPLTDAVRINVLDAFNSGGAQNRVTENNGVLEFGTLYTRTSDGMTLKSGIEGNYRTRNTVNANNFGGTFTFSNLDAYLAGTPLTYRITQGDPLFVLNQLEAAAFVQADLELTSRLTLLMGVRYEAQQNLPDYNNVAPRVSIAYSPSPATVIRAGSGIFHSRLGNGTVEQQKRLDGTHQYEIVVDNPAYPDPFSGGTVRQTLPSIRVTDADLAAPFTSSSMVSLERTFFTNLLFTATYDFHREFHRLRTRNLNAPYDASVSGPRVACSPQTPTGACVVPDPTRGNIINLESTGREYRHNVRLSVRKRFSIFNASANYHFQQQYGDALNGTGSPLSNTYDLHRDWGRSSNPNHSLNASVNARLPLGLFLTGNMSWNSRRHYTMTTGADDNGDSNVNDRPAGVEPNSLDGPRYLNFDFNVSKAIFFGGPAGATSGTNANVFINLTNAFNRIHYGTPSGVLTSPNFGKSTSANDPREVEVGVRFQF